MRRIMVCFSAALSMLVSAAVQGAPAAKPAAAKPAADAELQSLAEGAVVIATAKLRESRVSADGEGLLKFALALSPESRKALMLQAKLEESLPLENVKLADGGAAYVNLLLKAAADTKRPQRQRLLFLRAVLFVQPENEMALIELMKAKNRNVGDISFDALLADAKAGWKTTPAPDTKETPAITPPPKPVPGAANTKTPNPAQKEGGGEAGAETAVPEIEIGPAPKFFRWDDQKKVVKYFYKTPRHANGNNGGSTAVYSDESTPMTYYYNEYNSYVSATLDDPQCSKLTDGKVSQKHQVSPFSVGWHGRPPPACFMFPFEATLRTFRIFIFGCDTWNNDSGMPATITLYDGTSKARGNVIATKTLPSTRKTGWVEIPLTMKAPSSCIWVEMERSTQGHVIVEEVEFKN